MFRTDTEIKVGRALFVDGLTQEQAGAIAGVTQGRVSQIKSMLIEALSMIGVDTNNPAEVSSAIGAILRRAEERRRVA